MRSRIRREPISEVLEEEEQCLLVDGGEVLEVRPHRRGLAVVSQLRKGFGGILPMLERVSQELGEVCLLSLPGFSTVLLSGPEPIRQMLVDKRDAFLWRPPHDPVTKLLRRGLLVVVE